MAARAACADLPAYFTTPPLTRVRARACAYIFHLAPTQTVITDDYVGFFSSSSASCVPMLDDFSARAPAGTEPSTGANGIIARNSVRLELSMSAADALAHADAVAHLQARLAQGGSLAFGVDLMATHPHFGPDTDCAIQVPYEAPYYTVEDFVMDATSPSGDLSWTVDLAPTGALSLFRMHSANISIVPDAAAELERRAAAREPLGEDVRTDAGRRLAVSIDKSLGSFNLNYDPSTKAAAKMDIELISGAKGALTCNNCYAYYSGNIKVNMLACLDYYFTCTTAPCDVARDTTNIDGTKSLTTLPAGNDCEVLKTIGSATSSSVVSGYGGPSKNIFNMGFKASGQVTGAAGFGFSIKSSGISAGANPNGDIFPSTKLDTITVTVAGIPVSVTPTVGLAAKGTVSGEIKGSLEFGASASLAVDLGAEVSAPSVWDAAGKMILPTVTAFKKIDFTYGVIPFKMTTVTAAANVNLNVVPEVLLAVYNAIPIQIDPSMNVKVNLAMGARRRLKSANEPEYSAGRALAASCAKDTVSFSASTGGSLGIVVQPVQANDLVGGLNTAILKGAIPSTILSPITGTIMAKTDVVPAGTSIQAETSLVAAQCSAVGGSAVPAIAAPASSSSGGGGGGSSSSSSSTCDSGCVAGAVIGTLLGVALVAAGVLFAPKYGYYAKKAAAAPKGADLVVRVPAGPTVVSANPVAS